MRKIILKKITTISIAAVAIMAAVVFVIQIIVSSNNAAKTSDIRLNDALATLAASDAAIAELTENLDADYISKANAFAEMIRFNPAIISDAEKLEEIRELLEVDELHVTDGKGVIHWGTIPEYFGFDFSTSEQTKPFLPILEDNTLEIAQEAQPNGAAGKLFQYISVPRRDSKGIVQIGMEPTRLTEALKDNQPDVTLGKIKVGTSGTVFAVNKSDMTVAAFFDSEKIGMTAEKAGLNEKTLTSGKKGSVSFKINGTTYFSKIIENDKYYIGTLIPQTEVIGEAAMITGVVTVLILLVIGFFTFSVCRIVEKNIINGMTEIGNAVKAIGEGNSELRVDVRTCDEFCTLSDGINGMVANIEANISSAKQVNTSMEDLIGRIGGISHSINTYAGEMEDVSKQLSDGSTTQAATVQELSAAFSAISKEVNDNAEAAKHANEISARSSSKLKENAEKMRDMQDSMTQISEASKKISNIVKTINDIAFQTNILALNASVEAARAGEHGKGFAVVADEVRNLANKSAEAAKVTTELIDETLSAVRNGIVIADETAAGLNETTESIAESTQLISEIAQATIQQAKSIDQAADGMNQISEVVQRNTGISFNAQDTAKKLDAEAEKLIDMVNSRS